MFLNEILIASVVRKIQIKCELKEEIAVMELVKSYWARARSKILPLYQSYTVAIVTAGFNHGE